MRVISRVLKLVSEKQIRENRVISAATIARETGLSRLTVGSWLRNEVKRFDEESIIAFCKYFDCDISELLVLEKEKAES
ncbi:MAG: helix-turn-helix transcriptional regulator [Chloroflexota bacterium]